MITKEQEELRRLGIGGSDAAGVAGLSKWHTPLDIYNKKMGLKPEQKETEAMKIGAALESVILDKYEELTGNIVERDLPTVFMPKHDFILANVDGFVRDKNIVVEAKTARNKDGWGAPGSCDIPIDYLCQVAHYCAVFNAPEAHIIVLFKFNETYEIYKYKRNENLEQALLKKEQQFWENYILKNTPPPVTTIKHARMAFNSAQQAKAYADDEAKQKFSELLKVIEQKKKLQEIEEQIKLDLMLKMGVSNELVDEAGQKLVSWKNVSSQRFNSVLLKKSNPDLYSQYCATQTTRTFLPNYKYAGMQRED